MCFASHLFLKTETTKWELLRWGGCCLVLQCFFSIVRKYVFDHPFVKYLFTREDMKP